VKKNRNYQIREATISCDFLRGVACVKFPCGNILTYRVFEQEGRLKGQFLPGLSTHVEGIDGNNPQLLASVGESWLKMQAGNEGRIRFEFSQHITLDKGGNRIPKPELEPEAKALVSVLITMDEDLDGVVVATLAEVHERAQLVKDLVDGKCRLV
jgi:hypothetical protein